MTKEKDEATCLRIQRFGEQHPLFHAAFMQAWRYREWRKYQSDRRQSDDRHPVPR